MEILRAWRLSDTVFTGKIGTSNILSLESTVNWCNTLYRHLSKVSLLHTRNVYNKLKNNWCSKIFVYIIFSSFFVDYEYHQCTYFYFIILMDNHEKFHIYSIVRSLLYHVMYIVYFNITVE